MKINYSERSKCIDCQPSHPHDTHKKIFFRRWFLFIFVINGEMHVKETNYENES